MKTPNSTSILDEHKKPNEIQQSSSKLSRRKFIMYGSGIAGSVALVGSKGIRASQHEIAIENLKKTPPGTVQSSTISNSTSNSIPPLSGRITAAPGIVSLTPGQEENAVLEYPFNDGFLFGVLVSNLHEFNTKELFSGQLNKDIILTNLGPQAVFISEGDESNNTNFSDTPLKRPLPPLQSINIRAGTVISTSDASSTGLVSLIQIRHEQNADSKGPVWAKYPFPSDMEALPLWLSKQAHLNNPINVNPWQLAGVAPHPGSKPLSYELYANLWWLPAGSDAGIHAPHRQNFLEVHTQLTGFGRMQKFHDLSSARDASSDKRALLPPHSELYPFDTGKAFPGLYEEIRLAPGSTHPPMPIVTTYNAWGEQSSISKNASIDDPCFFYPPHQYYADTDALWIAFEFHRAG
ncbi:hypothetical protein [Raoultella terrigena]|uniref:hypothetical protein n=1 Tax=Raoultella terrigena TaxID=577 RepID=UPI001115996C|nr:hypothetical protein [Raoultella terrigena]